jgi:hypothetical protein
MSERQISKTIRKALRALEKEVRFRLVKFYSAYNAILGHVLEVRGRRDLQEKIEPMPLYLECGSSNRITLGLISLGLTRPTAISAAKLLRSASASSTPEDYISLLRDSGYGFSDIPPLCKGELDQLLSR